MTQTAGHLEEKTIAQCGKGIVRGCSTCGCFEFEYGNFAVTLDSEGLTRFFLLTRESRFGPEKTWSEDDTLHLKLSNAGFRLVIPGREIDDLWQLLRDALRRLAAADHSALPTESEGLPAITAPSSLIH